MMMVLERFTEPESKKKKEKKEEKNKDRFGSRSSKNRLFKQVSTTITKNGSEKKREGEERKKNKNKHVNSIQVK